MSYLKKPDTLSCWFCAISKVITSRGFDILNGSTQRSLLCSDPKADRLFEFPDY